MYQSNPTLFIHSESDQENNYSLYELVISKKGQTKVIISNRCATDKTKLMFDIINRMFQDIPERKKEKHVGGLISLFLFLDETERNNVNQSQEVN